LETVETYLGKIGTQIKVLIVDDHPLVRIGLEMRLSLEGDIEVVGTSGDGSQALDAVEELQPNVVIMDYILPTMDGIQVTRRITKQHPEVSVIILSIEDNHYIKTKAIEAGARAFVVKQLGTDRLLSEIRMAGSSTVAPPEGFSRAAC
jgi:DNA-binding NarL/FixJ family response regulator